MFSINKESRAVRLELNFKCAAHIYICDCKGEITSVRTKCESPQNAFFILQGNIFYTFEKYIVKRK